MKAWILRKGASSLDDMHLVERDRPVPAAGQVLVRVRACSLNYRDQLVARGAYMGGPVADDTIPLSDGAGEVVALGAGVTQVAVGDRVAGLFFQNWTDGPPRPDGGPALGASGADGMLAEYVVLPEGGVVPIAQSLDFASAACLPCAGVTAWNALMQGHHPVKAGDHVLVLGTGGVSLLALQIARAAGAHVIATSGSAAKAARVRDLGAEATVNYREVADWGAAAAALTGKSGFDHVVEVGGAGTLTQSMMAVGYGGEIALIGVLSREGNPPPHMLMGKGANLRGIFVGSAAMARALNDFVDAHAISPVIDRVFAFDEAKAAFAHQSSPDLFGKVVITV
jgi:NADPH:quinone reductase-like Zn-dependent oxidoreductase